MSKQVALHDIPVRSLPVYIGALLPYEPNNPRRVTFRYDKVLSPSEIADIAEVAYDTVGVLEFRAVPDQLTTPHTMFIMVLASALEDDEIYRITNAFNDAVNADYNRTQQDQRKPVFSH